MFFKIAGVIMVAVAATFMDGLDSQSTVAAMALPSAALFAYVILGSA